jgi:UDP-N-acetylmuramoyl-tripeptide--D-alanyl-D-alanine ligase
MGGPEISRSGIGLFDTDFRLKADCMSWTAATLSEAVKGEILSGDPTATVGAISTDTRKITRGHCFIALAGENHDGHTFVPDAIRKGASAVVVSEWNERLLPEGSDAAVIRVRDSLYALGEIARSHRNRFDIPVIAISGSNGKTSTKEMVSAIFSRNRKVLRNKGNFNNLIGLPLTLLELNGEHQIAVVEMGINVPGEMERLVEIGTPTVGVITNVQPAHLEGLQSLDRILLEKGKLWESLGTEGLAVVNLDDCRLSRFANGIKARKLTFSRTDSGADVWACTPVRLSEKGTSFRIRFGGDEISVALPVIGFHHAQNALAAAAAALGSGASPDEVETGLSDYEPIGQRMQFLELPNGRVLIDDTYNANPGSMLAAVEAVLAAGSGRPFVAVLGEMKELGEASADLHFDLGKKVGSIKPSRLITLGEMGLQIQKGARAAGLDGSLCFHAGSHEEAIEFLRARIPERAWILVKGSRAMTMERIVEGLAGKWL